MNSLVSSVAILMVIWYDLRKCFGVVFVQSMVNLVPEESPVASPSP